MSIHHAQDLFEGDRRICGGCLCWRRIGWQRRRSRMPIGLELYSVREPACQRF